MKDVKSKDLKRIADEIGADAFPKLTTAFEVSEPEMAEGLRARGGGGGGLGWDCTGSKFTCGDYTCTGVVGCSGEFGCTIKFSGLTAQI
jgi:hypothetical protein